MKKINLVFFGTPEFSVKILDALNENDLAPSLVVTAADKPRGRKMKVTPSPVKEWALKFGIPVQHDYSGLENTGADLFVVASFGRIIPGRILNIPKKGVLNVHPSLLPKLRGASPIQSAILFGEKETGMTIMLMDEKMDEGPILLQEELDSSMDNITFSELEEQLAQLGAKLLVRAIPDWISGKIKPKPQDHAQATYTKLIKKEEGQIDWKSPPEEIYRKIRALTPRPGVFTFSNGKRVIITKAALKSGELLIERVKPEGKNEMEYSEYLRYNPSLC